MLGLFAVAWLSMAMQPCAMAFGGDSDGDCPHCPPAISAQGHAGHTAGDDPAAGVMPCADGGADCDLFDQYNYDGRSGQGKVKDAPTDLLLAILPAPARDPRILRDSVTSTILKTSAPPGVPPALNVLYCVYLD